MWWSNSRPIVQWSPVRVIGSPKGRYQALMSAWAKSLVPRQIPIILLPCWCVARVGVPGNRYQWRLIRPVEEIRCPRPSSGFNWSVSSLASKQMRTSAPTMTHLVTNSVRSVMNIFWGFGWAWQASCNNQNCWQYVVLELIEYFWLWPTWYPLSIIICWSWQPASLMKVHQPSLVESHPEWTTWEEYCPSKAVKVLPGR